MELLPVASNVFMLLLGLILGLIYFNYQAQRKVCSEPNQKPKAPAWVFLLQNVFSVFAWVSAGYVYVCPPLT